MKWPQSHFENIIWITFFPPFWHGFQRVWSHSKFDSVVFLSVFTEKDGERCCSLSVLCSSFSHLYESKPQARLTRATDGWAFKSSQKAQFVLRVPEASTALAYGQPAPYGVCKRRKWSDGHVLKGILGLNRKRAQRKVTVTSPALWSGRRCSVPGKPVSPSQCVHKHHRARWLKRESFIFFGSCLTC